MKEDCKNCEIEYKETGCPLCYSCMMTGYEEEVDLKLFKYPELVNVLRDLNYDWSYEYDEPIEYSNSGFWNIERNEELVEGLTPEDFIDLYEKIKKELENEKQEKKT